MMRRKGYALATILILLGITLFGAGAIVTISILESKISRSQQEGITAYYVAEAGVQDALWRLNNNSTYSSALVGGTLNVTYTANDAPATGQSFTVTMVTSPTLGAGYGEIDVTGTSNNGDFIATRRIETQVFQGALNSPIGENAFFGGGSLTITNGATDLQLINGGLYSSGSISISNATVNAGTHTINAVGNYTANPQSNVTSGGIYAANYPPPPSAVSTPGFDFTYYSNNYTVRYTPTQFRNLVSSGGSTINLPGPVTFINGDLSFGNWARNKTINVTGMFIINGALSVSGSVTNMRFNVLDPGTHKSGIFIRTNANITQGRWNVNGLFYASGSLSYTNSEQTIINGGVIAGGSVSINTGLVADLTFNEPSVTASLGSTTPLSVEVQHWEEEY